MSDKKVIEAIGKMMEEKLNPINERLEIIEIKQKITHEQLNDLKLDIKISERTLKKDIHRLQDTLITVLEAKDILLKVENL